MLNLFLRHKETYQNVDATFSFPKYASSRQRQVIQAHGKGKDCQPISCHSIQLPPQSLNVTACVSVCHVINRGSCMFCQLIRILQAQGPRQPIYNRRPHCHTVQAATYVQLDKVMNRLLCRTNVTIFFKGHLTELHHCTQLTTNQNTHKCKIPSTTFLASELSLLSLGTQQRPVPRKCNHPRGYLFTKPFIPSLHYF